MASLTPLNSPLGLRRAKHLLRRTSFRYDKSTLLSFAALSAPQAMELLLEPTVNTLAEPYDPIPTDAPHGVRSQYHQVRHRPWQERYVLFPECRF
jgi:hypothetical protein